MAEEDARVALDMMNYGMYVIGSHGPAGMNVMAAHWLMQVSFKPRMVALSLEQDARTLANIRETRVFSVNVMGEDSVELVASFLQPAHRAKIQGRSAGGAGTIDKLAGVPHRTMSTGCPILRDALAWYECEVEGGLPTGDHTLVVARVVDGGQINHGKPLRDDDLGWTYSG
ncbi:MAG TPA: flavin reductase family protein [Dehalococcoidia bacterium]|nr:flavin reductase family protein [Dehalococcoidia bacterium]